MSLSPEPLPSAQPPIERPGFQHLSPAFPGRAPWGTASSLRAWQAQALDHYLAASPRDFLAVATPGAGKTTFALRVAKELLERRIVRKVIVVTPTEHLKVQWAEAAHKVGLAIDPGLGASSRRGRSREYAGSAVTYAGVAARMFHYRAVVEKQNTLVILDEVHHAGDARSWGEAVKECFEPATRRLALTGTPFRSDDNPIPFVRYEPTPDGGLRSAADYTYGYAEALRDHVVRPVLFMNYGGPMRWRTKAGDELEANLGDPLTKDVTAHAWRTALDPKGEWITAVLRAADHRLSEVRRHIPDAGGLVIATDQASARAYARVLQALTGSPPAVVLSDDAGASNRIESYAASTDRWLVAVRMVSEGVDVPRLAVGVYATATSTPLFFAQAVGRFVRARRRGELATVFLPTVALILSHAALLERQRDHVLGAPTDKEGLWDEEAVDAANRDGGASEDLLGQWEALGSAAEFDHVMYDAHQFGLAAVPGSQDEHDYLGLPGLLEPDQVHAVLQERQRRHLARQQRRDRREKVPADVSLHRALEAKRKELNSLVNQYARHRGMPHSHVHAELRRQAGGPPLSRATTEQVEHRIALIRRWHTGR
ncbi:MAG: DEAD/DEAH box helicase [Tetrasphaera sp.]